MEPFSILPISLIYGLYMVVVQIATWFISRPDTLVYGAWQSESRHRCPGLRLLGPCHRIFSRCPVPSVGIAGLYSQVMEPCDCRANTGTPWPQQLCPRHHILS